MASSSSTGDPFFGVSDAHAQSNETGKRFEQLMEMMPAGVIACDAAGQIVFFNRRATEIWHSTPEPMESYESFASRFRVLSGEGKPLAARDRHIARALKEGISFDHTEAIMERPDGSRFIAQFNIRPTSDAKGVVTGAIVVFQDVTAERGAQLEYQDTQERYRAIFQQASVGIFECDLHGRIVRSNPALSRIMGFTPEELREKNWRELAHREERKDDVQRLEKMLRGDIGAINGERRYRRKDGSVGWVDVVATLIRDPAGAPMYGLAVVIDISERKRTELELRETEARFRVAADNAPVLIWISDTEKRCTWFNQPWLEFVGRSLEQEQGEGWIQNVHPEDQSRCRDIFYSAFDRREDFSMEYRIRRQDGAYRWLLAHGVPRHQGPDFAGYIGSCFDITDRRAAEEAMNASRNAERARRQEMEVLTQVAPAGIWMALDPDCRVITGNAAAHAMMRSSGGKNLALASSDRGELSEPEIFRHGKLLSRDELAMRVAARTGKPVINEELELRFFDGTSTWVYGSATPLMDERGLVRGVICVMVDVTERKRAEAALLLSEQQLRLVTDHTSVMFARFDRDQRYRFVNRTYSERYRRPLHEFIGMRILDVISADAYRVAQPQIEKALAGQTTEFEVFYPDLGCWGHVIYEPECGNDGMVVGVVAVVVDITRRKQAEMDLQRARDEALAASRAKDDFLAALSHELRTPLSPVLLLASEAASDRRLSSEVRADFETIRKSVELEARLIDDLLDLTRITRGKLVLELRPLDLSIVVRDALTTVAADLEAKQIDAKTALATGPVWVCGDAVRLQQVFWNVLKNAVKFTPCGGRVVITSRVDEVRGEVVVEITDTGIGITAQELERVFEAFAQGDHAAAGGSHRFGGLGLGLAISRRVIELHHGQIGASSEGRDQGATFRVELPLFVGSEGPEPTPDFEAQEPPPAGGEEVPLMVGEPATLLPAGRLAATGARRENGPGRILLVEDHAPTRMALEHLLLRRRYDVRSAASAAQARTLARQEKFDLLISDIGLPDGSGYDLMKEFHESYGMVGISLTGYGMEADISRSRDAGFVQHLTKPVRMQSLEEALSSIAP